MILLGHPARRRVAGWLLLATLCAALSPAARAQADGSAKWGPFSVGGTIVSSPAVGPDGTIYVGVYRDKHPTEGSVIAILPSGGTKWEWKAPDGVDSSPAVSADGTIYVGCWDGKLYALNASNGTKRWHVDTTVFISTSSPAIGPDGTIYIGSANSALHAVSPAGTELWERQVGGAINSSPAVAPDGTIYFGSEDRSTYALNRDGTVKWSVPTGGAVNSSPAIGADGTVYVGSDDGRIYAIRPEGNIKWSYLTGGQVFASPVLAADGTIYVGSYDKLFYALNPDGSVKWRGPAGKAIASSALVRADGTVIYGSDDGVVRAVNPADATPKWSFTANDFIEASLAIGPDGTIYVAQLDGRIYARNGNGSPLSAYSSWPMFRRDAAHSGTKPPPSAGGWLVNLSTRAPAGTGANLISGLFVNGAGRKNCLLRGIGPTLASFGVASPLADPKLELFTGQVKLAENDNWGSDGDGAEIDRVRASVGAFSLPAGSKDATVVASLVPGPYTAVISGADASSGVALAEAYDADQTNSTSRFMNLSTRAHVRGGEAVIPGLVIGGTGTLQALVRAIGPGLIPFGVSNALARPTMNLFSGSNLLRSNTGWTSGGAKADLAAAMATVGAFALADGSADCAMLVSLNAGSNNYTIQVAGVGGTIGEVLVEVYVVP